uniref:Uncharacterized protein n=1 Tax=Meloidogyne hapla TaxID=6305 RepID=A0A1I8BST1_MELHA
MPSPFHYPPTMSSNLGPSPSAAEFAITGNFPAAMSYFPTSLVDHQQSPKLDQSTAAAMSLYYNDPSIASAATYFPTALYATQPFVASNNNNNPYSHIPQGNTQQQQHFH